jgi:two-component system, cell cycle response regulator DivK
VSSILIVEDNEMNRDILSRRLARRGYRILTAVDGGDGIAVARRERPDLILMDLGLPIIDGWDAVRQLRADPATSRIPIIAVSAYAMTTDRARALEIGCDDYQSKPIDLEELLQRIRGLLGAERGPPRT